MESPKIFNEIKLKIEKQASVALEGLTKIFTKLQNDVKKVNLRFAAINAEDLIKLLSLLPKLEEIVIEGYLYNLPLITHQISQQKKLAQLKQVRILTCNVESTVLALELPDHCLKKLTLNCLVLNITPSTLLFETIFAKQKNIEDFYFDACCMNADILKMLKLKHLKLSRNRVNRRDLMESLQSQQNLTNLNVLFPLNSENFNEVLKLQILSKLTINVINIDSTFIESLNALKMLKDLTLTLNPITQSYSFAHIIMNQLENLNLQNGNNTSSIELIAEDLPKAFPNLKHLILETVTFKTFANLLENRNLKFLEISVVADWYASPLEVLVVPHENLMTLKVRKILKNNENKFLKFLMASMPALRKLRLNNIRIERYEMLELIMKSFSKLTHIAISSPVESFGDNFAIPLLSFGRNLEFVEFTTPLNLNSGQISPPIIELNCIFELQFAFIYSDGNRLIMRNSKWD